MRGSQKSSVQSIALDIPNRFFNDNALIAPLPFSGNVRIVAILLVASIITACGGGGSGSGSNQVQVTGIVARGAPAVGAIVSATCQGWSGHAAPTDDSGRYSIAVTGLPCKLSTVLSSDGSILNSMTTEGGIVNLTPFTELVFQLSSGDPNKLPSGLILSQQYLASLGLEIASQENPITISFNTNGLGYDAQLDTFSKLVAETPITGAGSTSQLNAFINSAVVSSVANGDGVSINNRLSSYTQAWNTFWGKFGSSDPFFGIVNGTTKFVATYSTELREKFDQLPREFDNLTNQQTENIAKFVEGWKTCGFQETATTRQCFLGRMSAIVIDFGFHWVGTAVVTTVSVVGAPVEIATEASFKLYKNVTTSMLDAELQSGVINQVEYEAFVSTNDAVADFARIAYDAVSTAKDAAEGIQKVNVGVRTLKNNFAGKNIARISTFAKMRDPFKKMISGTFTGFSSIKGAISGWSQSDKDLFRQYLFQASDELMAAIFGQDSIPTNSPPIAAFTANPISASIGSVITFDGNTSVDPDGTITSYKWDFGDGTSGNGSRVTHTYAVAKSYVVTLTVTDNLSATVNAAKPIIITTTPKPDLVPSAVTVSPATVAPGSTITVNWTITNSGNANAAASTTELRLLAASDAINSTSASLVLGLPTGALAVGASAAPSQVITIPAATAPGSYRIVVASDSGNSIGQSNLANDFSGSSAFTVGPAANAMLTNPSNGHRYEIIVCGTWTQCNVAAKARGDQRRRHETKHYRAVPPATPP